MATMTAPGVSTFDLVPPYRPGDADLNSHALTDDAEDPPGDGTLPSSALFNTESNLIVGFGAMAPLLVMSITGGNPPTFGPFTSIVKAVRQAPASSNFTLTRLSIGEVTITWPAGLFGNMPIMCIAGLNTALFPVATQCVGSALITNGVGVATSSAGALADLSFTVAIF